MKRFLTAVIITLSAILPVCASSSMAAMTEKDVLVIARIIDLIQDGPKGEVKIAIVANTPASQENTDSLLSRIEKKNRVRNTTLVAKKVTPAELALSAARVVILPEGLDAAQFDDIFAIASEKKLITISNSTACIQAKRCAIAFKSDPAVDIRMSQSAAAATGVNFAPTLRMMITELP